MIPYLPPGGGEEDWAKAAGGLEEDCDPAGETERAAGTSAPYSSQPGSPPAFQLRRDKIQPPNVRLHFGQQLLGNQTPVLTQSFKEGSQPAPWETDYESRAVTERIRNSGSGNAISFRTIWHPSFCALFDAQDQNILTPPEVEGNREHSQSNKDFPALCSEDFFFSDPLLPSITRIPLGLSQSPQQILRRSRQLLAPPPIMSVSTQPNPAPILTWQCGPEITAVTCLLEMSQGETESTPTPKPSLAASTP
ncbi:histone deacetylase complex subunit SAP25 [Macrotis lagotis]|uniref:histone deacetylase complex subunit SAP25 n=1 Tax=Macrotis lagotis TaxID=92651 RepID=UPI003D69C7DC